MPTERSVRFDSQASSAERNPRRSRSRGRKRISAYDPIFEQHLNDHGVYTQSRAAKPANLDQIRHMLQQRRPSLSPTRFTEADLKDFIDDNTQCRTEATVMNTVVPIVVGKARFPSQLNVTFCNLAALTDGTLKKLQPDLYDGCQPEDLRKSVRDQFSDQIVPSANASNPVLPNFFLEAKCSNGSLRVNRLQACYGATLGARAMHSLRMYTDPATALDDNAYSISATFLEGSVVLYVTHPVASKEIEGFLEYHTTRVKGYDLINDVEEFREGATALRNARMWAQQQRSQLVAAANLAGQNQA